jgi:hypothetical protein
LLIYRSQKEKDHNKYLMGMQVAVMVVILGKMAEIREEKLEVVA